MISDITMMTLLFTAIGQIMLYVDGMNGVINHSDTIQWLYSLTASRVSNYARFFSGYSGFQSPLLKNQHFQLPIRSGMHGHISMSSQELLSAL